MDKKYYMLYLLPPRPTFALDMSDSEREIMMQHVAYWKEKLDKGMVVVYGPVMDPAGPYGMGVICVDDEAQAKELMANDPAARINTYEWHPMRAVLPQQPKPIE